VKHLTVLLILGLALGCNSKSESQANRDDAFREHGFPLFPSARYLCEQRVYGAGVEISWDALTTTEAPNELAAFYTERLGPEALKQDADGWTWRLPVGSSPPDRVLSVNAVTNEGPWTECDEVVPSDTRTVLLLSTMHKR
jgi:hypothetical protein